MRENAAVLLCRHCGAPRQRYLGDCRVCGEHVCASCGNLQDSVAEGRFPIHTLCIKADPDAASSAFSFIKFVK
jgi:predicted ATP-dependent serine protease